MNGIAILYDALSSAENELDKLKNPWVKCSDRLPEPFDTSEELRNSSNRHLIYYTEDGENWFVDFGWYLYGDRRESDGNLMPPYWELDNIGLSNVVIEVSHWQPLPQPPID